MGMITGLSVMVNSNESISNVAIFLLQHQRLSRILSSFAALLVENALNKAMIATPNYYFLMWLAEAQTGKPST